MGITYPEEEKAPPVLGMSEHLEAILRKMCSYVDVDFDSMDFKKENWFHDHEWLGKDEKDFTKWMTNYLFMSRDAREELLSSPRRSRPACRGAAIAFVWNFGWKVRDV